jgi:uncharacterized membrane protein
MVALAVPAFAKSEFLDVLTETYKPYADKLTERSCANCHVSLSDYTLNSFGKQIRSELAAANTKELTAAILKKVEPLDADQDGTSNIDEIKAGTDPADPKSGGKPGFKPSAAPAPEQAPAPKPKPLVPKNAFHPAIVHFPIALFIAGLFLDFLGMWRKHKTMLLAGWYNLLLGAISTLASILSGLTAMLRMHLPFSGLIFQHLLLACIGTVIMWLMVALRYNRHEKMNTTLRIVYYVLAVTGVVLIAYSAHLGGAFVYGE